MQTKIEPSNTQQSITAFVVCCNEAKHIRRCLESIKWCHEIVVVDSGSTDGTLDICREYTSRIFQRPWPGFVEQKRYALAQCRSDWVLNIDADEEVSPELKDEILSALSRKPQDVAGFYLPRVVFYLGRWWRKGGWYPEFRLRLCKRAVTSWGGSDPHEKAIVQGPTTRLRGELRHFTYDSLSDQLVSINSLSSSAAKSLHANRCSVGLVSTIMRPMARFLKFYVLKRGYREGKAGFVVACLEAVYVLVKYFKLWEMNELTPKSLPGENPPEPLP